jgi:dihydropyrimidine dehydrogenase (NAD+) subunit PreA
VNLDEIKVVKRDWPDRAMVVSLMVPCDEESWRAILPLVEETGADGVELNFGCPHGMSERGMGSAVGQVPEYIEMVTALVQDAHPHAGDREAHAERHRHPQARRGGAGRAAPMRSA